MNTNVTDTFLRQTLDFVHEAISEDALHDAKRCILDYLGATLAGAYQERTLIEGVVNSIGAGTPDASLIGLDARASLLVASLVNGISSHTVELDDGVISGIIHPGTPILSALLPVAEKECLDGYQLLLGTIAGYEVAVRVANAIQPEHKMSGYHATATCGALGATVGIGVMCGLPFETIKNAFSAAAVSAGGSLKVLEDNSQLKPVNSGNAAMSAIVANSLAQAGYAGPNDVLSGDLGFVEMMGGTNIDNLLGVGGNDDLAIGQVYFKPYAACRYSHAAIQATLELKEQHSLDASSVEQISIETYSLAVANHDHTAVESTSSAKMSIPYSVATALIHGSASLDAFSTDTLNSVLLRDLTKRVTVRPGEKYTAQFPQKTGAKVDVLLKTGETLSMEVENAKGDPMAPLSDEELIEKFFNLCDYSRIDSDRKKRIQKGVFELPRSLPELIEEL